LLTGGTLTFKTFLQKEQQWQLRVEADTPPTVERVHAGASPTGATKLAYTVKDDHALQSLRGIITAHKETTDELGNTEYFFDIPPIADSQGHEQRHLIDLTPHLWAGKKVNLTLRATDSFDQEATSAPVAFTLPERRFHNP